MSDVMRLNTLSPAPGARKNTKRVGRGIGSGVGKTAGRGHKGQKSRSGGTLKPGFEGGQMPLQKRLPKYGFSSRIARTTAQVRLGELNAVEAEVIDLAALKAADLVKDNVARARVFLSGELGKAVTVKGLAVTKGAREAIEKAGGKVEDLMATPQLPSANKAGLGELFARLRYVLLAIIVYRIGTHIPVPGIDPNQLSALFNQNQGTILGLANMFSGGALERMSILALGIMPYISASIIMQLMSAVTPQLEQLKKEGESGRRKISQYTRYLTVVLAIIQATGMTVGMANQGMSYDTSIVFFVIAITSLVTGAVFMMWLGEQITEKGVGNGISLLIFAGIVAGLPAAIGQSLEQARQGELNILILLFILTLAIAVIYMIVFIERGQRRITVNYAKRQQGRKMYQAQSSHLPLKVNMAGVIPAIFASSILLFPASIAQWFGSSGSADWLQDLAVAIGPGQPLNILLFTVFIVFFCFFYTALMFNPVEVADNLKRSGAFVPGIRPGQQTANYIDGVLTRLTVFGAAYIALVCLMPQFLVVMWNVPFYLGGTSLLIVVVVVMDFMAQVQSHLMSHQYDSVMKKANLKNYGGAGRVR